MRKIVFRLLFIFVLIIIALYLVTSQFSITELIYPVKIDSLYLHAEQRKYEKESASGGQKPGKIFLYHPSQLGLVCKNLIVKTPDSLLLKSWFVADSSARSAVTVIIIPDIKESKFTYIDEASELVARGLNVCLVDLRAQGESEGNKYTVGEKSVQDISLIMDSVISKFKTENIVLMGTGTGAAIILNEVLNEKRVNVLVLQNLFVTFNEYLKKYAEEKYGGFTKLFFKQMKKNLEEEMQFSADSLDLPELVEKIQIPSLFISKISENHLDYKSTQIVSNASAASKKEWLVYKDPEDAGQNLEEKKKYYDKIAAFINSHIPKKKKQSKFKRLVYN